MTRAPALAVVVVMLASTWAFGAVEPFWSTLLAVIVLGVVVSVALAPLGVTGGGVTFTCGARMVLAAAVALPALSLVPVPLALREVLTPGVARLLSDLGVTDARPLGLDPHAALRSLLLAAAGVGAAWCVVRAARAGHAVPLLATLAAGGAALAVFGLVQRFVAYDPTHIYWTIPLREVGTPFGPYVNRNHFAGAMELLAPCAAGLSVHLAARGRRGPAWAAGVAAGCMALALIATASRGGVLGGGVAALVFLIGTGAVRRRRALLGLGAAGVVGVGLVAAFGAGNELLKRFVTSPWTTRAENRFLVQRDALEVFAANPWTGTGAGSFTVAYPPFQTIDDARWFGDAHSDWVQFLMEFGVLGVAFAVGLGAVLFRPLRSGLRASHADRLLVLGPLAGCAAIAVHGLFDVNLHVPSNALLTIAALSLAYGAACRDGADDARSRRDGTDAAPDAPGSDPETGGATAERDVAGRIAWDAR